MRFRGLDLNLLVTLDRLLAERNVSRAAERLNLSQSAASGALARLREYFADELLVQAGRGMALTPRAEELQRAVRSALMQIEATVLARPEPDLAQIRREIRIIASDYVCIAFLSGAIRAIREEAPGLSFTLLPPSSLASEELARGDADLVVMPERFLSAEHPAEHLFTDSHAAVVDAGLPGADAGLDLARFMELPQVAVHLADGPPNYETALADILGNRRRIEVVCQNFASVPFMLIGTERVAIVHDRLARLFARSMPLLRLPCPVVLPPLRIGLQSHALAQADQVVAFVKARLLERGRAGL